MKSYSWRIWRWRWVHQLLLACRAVYDVGPQRLWVRHILFPAYYRYLPKIEARLISRYQTEVAPVAWRL